ncbi:MAG: hypothetical protein GY754_24445 [bacterium]|nr:hypothetical protein [bacterium]
MKKNKVSKILRTSLAMMLLIVSITTSSFASKEIASILDKYLTPIIATNIHDLIQERYPNTISFPDFIRQLNSHPDKVMFMEQVRNFLKQKFGIELDETMINAILENPEMVLDRLQFTTQELEMIRQLAAEANRKAGEEAGENMSSIVDSFPATLKSEYQLPQVFDYETFDTTKIVLPPVTPDEMIEGVYLGFLRNSTVSEDVQRKNTIFSEVIERLSLNLHVEEEKTFTVMYNGKRYTRLNKFVDALTANGHELTAFVRHYVAPFIPLYAAGPDGKIRPVASAVFHRTGLTDESGMESIFPLMHSEFVFLIRPTDQTEGQGIQASIQYYQGIPKTGFYGNDCTDRAAWLGETVSDIFSPKNAKKALILAGYMVDINKSIAEQQNLFFDGYAVLGVCNDTVAVVHTAIRNKPSSFPLLMNDEEILPTIKKRLKHLKKSKVSDDRFDRKIYKKLKKAIKKCPSDAKLDYLAIERAQQAFPWIEGVEPFFSTVDARRILFSQEAKEK